MSAIQELAPFIGAYHGKIRNAKDHSGMTLEELSEKSGVSFSTVTDAQSRNAGLIRDGDLSVAAWICIALIVGSALASAITFYAIRKERGGKHGVHQV